MIVAVGSVNAVMPDQTCADFLTFLPLATRDENGELEGRLAESWEHSPDYREWIYHLRTDVFWHDGTPVTAHDLKFTIDLLTHPDVLGYVYYDLSATVLNDSTLKIESSHVHEYQDDILYYPKHLLEHLDPMDFWDWEFWKRPVGNGPYRFVRYEPETMIEFEANPNYYRGKPSIERVILKFVGKTGGLTELLSGNGDAVMFPPPAHIHHLVTDPRFRVYHEHFTAGIGILWQHKNPRFRDPRVRRALTLAINRRELLQVLNFPENLPLIDGPITWRQFQQLPQPIDYNPAQARVLLDAAGWHNQDGDEIRQREGQEFRFTALAFAIGSSQTTDKSAVYIQAQLRQVGVQMDIQVLDKSVVMDRIRIGEFDAAFMIVGSYPRWFLRHFGADSPLGYNNPEVINLFDQADVTADPSEQDRIYRELMRIFRVEQPITYVRLFCNTYVVHRRIKGLSTPFRADLTQYMEELWIEEEKK